MTKFLLLLGPSGVGKSAIIDELSSLDSRFVYISPYTTRPLRLGERNKIHVSDEQLRAIEQRGELLAINGLFGGVRYGTPKLPITEALENEMFPVLDWPVKQLDVMMQTFPERLFVVYVSPPSLDVLRQRLLIDKRDVDGLRIAAATEELREFCTAEHSGDWDLEVVSADGKIAAIALTIYSAYLESLE